MSETKRRRVLSEIPPPKNHSPNPKRRRKSPGFQMVKIVTSPGSKMNHQGSLIPVLKPGAEKARGLTQRLSFEAPSEPPSSGFSSSYSNSGSHHVSGFDYMSGPSYASNQNHPLDPNYSAPHNFPSDPSPPQNFPSDPSPPHNFPSDPSPPHNFPSEVSGSNVDKYKRLLSINNNLNLKTRITSGRNDKSPAKHRGSSPTVGVHEDESAYMHELMNENDKLDAEIAEAEAALAVVEEETVQFRLLFKALRTEVHELEKTISESEGRFEYLSNQITKKVEREEHDIEQKLKKIRSQRDDFLRESRFEVESEIKAKLEHDDTEDLAARRRLQAELEAVQAELEAFSEEKRMQLESERLQNDAAIRELENSASSDPELEDLRADLALLSETLRSKTADLTKLHQQQETVGRDIHRAEQALAECLKSCHDCDAQELSLRTQLSSGGRALDELLASQRSLESRCQQAKAEFSVQNAKYQQYQGNRRLLEFSIMSYSQKYDILLIPERFVAKLGIFDYTTVSLGSTSRNFSKVVIVGDEHPLSVSDSDIPAEWHLLIQERAQISKTRSLFFRFWGHPPDHKAIFECLDHGNDRVYLQSVGLKEGNLVDLLGNGAVKLDTEASRVVSEQRHIASGADLGRLVSGSIPSFQIFSVQGPTRTCTLYVAGFPEPQAAEGSKIIDFLREFTSHSTLVNVCDMRDWEGDDSSFATACSMCDL